MTFLEKLLFEFFLAKMGPKLGFPIFQGKSFSDIFMRLQWHKVVKLILFW